MCHSESYQEPEQNNRYCEYVTAWQTKEGKEFFSSASDKLAPVLTQLPSQWVTGFFPTDKATA
jgi:hypothetical protein